MVTITDVEFYNDIYRQKPDKWANDFRDQYAFNSLFDLLEQPEAMLDYGCGNGHTIAYFKEFWPKTNFSGLDISDVALEIAKQRVPEAEFYKVIPFRKTWDVITIMGVAEHFDDPLAELKHIRRLLSPFGYLYLEVPNCLAYSENKEEGFRRTNNTVGQEEWHWRRQTWEKVIEEARFDFVKSIRGPVPEWEFIWVLEKE